MSFNAYNPRSYGRFSTRKPYEAGDELYQHNDNQFEQQLDECWPSPLSRLRQPLFQSQRQPLQEFCASPSRELEERDIEDEQFTLVQKVIQSTLDQDEYIPMESLRRPSFEKEQISPIRTFQPSTLENDQFSSLQQLQSQQFSSLSFSHEPFSEIPQLHQSTFQNELISPMQQLQQPTFRDRLSPYRNLQQPNLQQEHFSSMSKLQMPSIEKEPYSIMHNLQQPTVQEEQFSSFHNLLQPMVPHEQSPPLPKHQQSTMDRGQYSPVQQFHREPFSLGQFVQPTIREEPFLPREQLRQPSLQQQEFLPLQQLRQPGVQQPARQPESTKPAEQLRQPKLRHSLPREEQIQSLKQLRKPSPQAKQPKVRQRTPPPPPSPPPRRDPKENRSNVSQASEDDMYTDGPDPVKKSSDKNSFEIAIDNLLGVRSKKKLSKREWRRRQNVHLRRILSPKNALIVLNEMLPGERVMGQFKVEPAPPHQYYNAHSFCAELTVDGVSYKGYGNSKLAARNDVAEQVFRDLILKHMGKLQRRQDANPDSGAGPDDWEDEDSGDEEDALPMIQLASFALHKLFTEWECDGHKVPQLKALAPPAACEESAAGGAAGGGGAANRDVLPTNAGAMQPCMLLAHLRPDLQYRELAESRRGPPYTMAVDLDGVVYSGTAASKKDARRAAAREACCRHFGVVFTDQPAAAAGTHDPLPV